MRRGLAAGAAALLTLLIFVTPAGAASSLTSQVEAAKKRANQAAARYAQASKSLERAEADVAALRAKTTAVRERVASLESAVRAIAVQRYVSGVGAPDMAGDPTAVARTTALLRLVTLGDQDAIEHYRVASTDLAAATDALEKRLDDKESAVASARRERAQVAAELDRLADALKALQAKQAAERSRAARQRGSRATPLGPIVSGSWVCPVQGAVAFTDSWGDPRSGGRRHEGVDMMARAGTPVVANVSGTVVRNSSSRGGMGYFLHGSDGNTYFGTHMSSYGNSGRVAAGTVIGYVGSTGNASSSAPHLHFEIHPGGGRPVNPYPTVRKHC